jgi:hypothetical protein
MKRLGARNGIFVVLGAIAFLVLLGLASATTFRVDDWDLVANRSFAAPRSFVIPFNQQFVAVPAILFRLIFSVVGLHSYLPYLVALLLLHLGVAAVVRRMVTQTSGAAAGTAALAVVLFLGVGYENLNTAFQMGQVLSTLTGLWALDEIILRRRMAIGSLLLVVAVASHAVGVAYLAGAAVGVALTDRRQLTWIAVPAAVFGLWVVAFDLSSLATRQDAIGGSIWSIALFMLVGPLTAVGAMAGLGFGAGVAASACAAACAIWLRRRPFAPILVVACGTALVAEYGLIGLSRSSFGIEAAGWSRYLYSAVPLVLVLIFAYAGSATRLTVAQRQRATLALAAVAMVSIVGNMRVYLLSRDTALEFSERVRAASIIVEWSEVAGPLVSDPVLPNPARLRELIEASGTPAHDDLIPQVVTSIREAAAREACTEMLPDGVGFEPCLAVVRTGAAGG